MEEREKPAEKMNTVRAPLVSVIMGTYEPDLPALYAAVRSIRNQTLPSWELLICDDGSTEDICQSIRKLAAEDPRIRFARNRKNMGLAHALNHCILHAGGEFIARMDADDISRPERLERQVEFLRENPDIMWVSCVADLFEGTRVWGRADRPERPDARSFLHSSPYIHPAVMYRREVFFPDKESSMLPGFRMQGNSGALTSGYTKRCGRSGRSEMQSRKAGERLYHVSPLTARCEDYELFMRLHSEGLRGYNLQDALFFYRESEKRMHRSFRSCLCEMLIRIQGFSRLGILTPAAVPYVLKPVFAGIASFFPGIAQRMRTGGRSWDRRKTDGESSRDRRKPDGESSQGRRKPDGESSRDLRESDEGQKSGNVPTSCSEEILADLFAPMILSFTAWVLREAEERGIRRLYFLSRDGYLPFRTAKRLVKRYGIGIECRYLYCSRYSLRVPMYSENVSEALSHVTRGGIDVTFRKILKRSGFRTEDMEKMQAEFPDIAPDEVIPYSALAGIRERLAESRVYTELLVKRSAEAWEPLREYFSQEGLLEQTGDGSPSVGIVDSGWTGTTQKSIDQIRKRCGIDTPVEGFYYGLFEIPKGADPEQYHCWSFGPKAGLINKVFFSNSLFEAIVRADEGTVCGYKRGEQPGRNMEPVTAPFRRNGIADRLFKYIERYLDRTAAGEVTIPPEFFPQSDSGHGGPTGDQMSGKIPEVCERLLTQKRKLRFMKFMWDPDPEAAEYFGSLPFSDDLLDETEREAAPVFPEEYLKENHFVNRLLTSLGIRKGTVHESAWFEGTCVRSAAGGGFLSKAASVRHRMSFSFYKAVSYLRKEIVSTR